MPEDPAQPPLPELPSWLNLKVFLLGAVWATLGGLSPTLVILYDWITHWKDPIDWTMFTHLAVSNAAMALVAYVRKHKALLSPPPNAK